MSDQTLSVGDVIFLIPTGNNIKRGVPLKSQSLEGFVIAMLRSKSSGSLSLHSRRRALNFKVGTKEPLNIVTGLNCGYDVFFSQESLDAFWLRQDVYYYLRDCSTTMDKFTDEQVANIGLILGLTKDQ
jgi:hypothetical protein